MKITHLCALVAALGLASACGNDNAPSRNASAPAADSNASAGASATTKTTPAERRERHWVRHRRCQIPI